MSSKERAMWFKTNESQPTQNNCITKVPSLYDANPSLWGMKIIEQLEEGAKNANSSSGKSLCFQKSGGKGPDSAPERCLGGPSAVWQVVRETQSRLDQRQSRLKAADRTLVHDNSPPEDKKTRYRQAEGITHCHLVTR